MTPSTDKPTGRRRLGFLTVLQEASGYLGGYLVTNLWGRPLEFRLTSAVQPNKVQQILYGGSLLSYISADLLGKTLVEKAGLPVHLIFTDREAVLDLRLKVEVPVVYVAVSRGPTVSVSSGRRAGRSVRRRWAARAGIVSYALSG